MCIRDSAKTLRECDRQIRFASSGRADNGDDAVRGSHARSLAGMVKRHGAVPLCSRRVRMRSMGFLDKFKGHKDELKDKATELAAEHSDKIDAGIDLSLIHI